MPETASHTEQGPPANGMHYGYESRDDERVPLTPPPPDRNARATVPQPLPVGDGGGASSRETTLLFRSEDLPLLLIGVVCIVALLLMLVNVFVVFGLVCKQRKRARRQSKGAARCLEFTVLQCILCMYSHTHISLILCVHSLCLLLRIFTRIYLRSH